MNTHKKIEMYLDWFNNFLTIRAFAYYYNISEDKARDIIKSGREAHNMRLGE